MSSGYNIEWQPENQDLLAIRCGHLTAMMTTCRNINTCDSCWNIPTAGCKTNPPDLLPSQLVVNSIILYATRDYIRLCWNLAYADAYADLLWEKNIFRSLKSTAEVVQANRVSIVPIGHRCHRTSLSPNPSLISGYKDTRIVHYLEETSFQTWEQP